MKDYFKRLKEHSGLGTAMMMTILGTLAGAGNESCPVLVVHYLDLSSLGLLFGQ